MTITVFNLAVLRAAAENQHPGTYFGSFASLKIWIAATRDLGWIDDDGRTTSRGKLIAEQLNLTKQDLARAYLWPNADLLVNQAIGLHRTTADCTTMTKQQVFFHGSPNRFEQFSYDFCSKSSDYMGSGFYFTSSPHEALGYAKDTPKVNLPQSPTIVVAKLELKHPQPCNEEINLTPSQVRALVLSAPNFDEFLRDTYDVDHIGLEAATKQALNMFKHTGAVNIRIYLNKLSNTVYGDDHIEAFNRNVCKYLNIDAMTDTYDNSSHVCAFFPEQIEVIDRVPAAEIENWIELNRDKWKIDIQEKNESPKIHPTPQWG